MTRPAIAHIRLDAFRHNYRLAKKIMEANRFQLSKPMLMGMVLCNVHKQLRMRLMALPWHV